MKKQFENQEELTIAFNFPLPPCLTLNKQIDLARSHWTKSAKFKKEWTEFMARSADSQVPKHILKKPVFYGKVWFNYLWVVNSHGNDEDNISAARKFICDGLKQASIIIDDNLSIIQSPTIHYWRVIKQIETHKVGANKKKLFLPKDLLEYPTNQSAVIVISNSMDFGINLINKKYCEN